MIHIYVQSTHSKIFYDESDSIEKKASEKILTTKFLAEDSNLKYDGRVRRGLMSPYINFYNKELNILPTGLLPYLFIYYKRSDIQYTITDLREFPKANKDVIRKLVDNGLSFGDYTPHDYQMRSILKIVKNKGGVIQLPTGCISWDMVININRCEYGYKQNIDKMYRAFNGLNKNWKHNYDKNKKTYVRSYDGEKIQLNEVAGVSYSGVKDLLILTLENNNILKATSDHKVMTDIGWVEMGRLKVGMNVMCDTLKPVKIQNVKKKQHDKMVWNLWHHPFAKQIKTKKERCGYSKRIEIHRAIYEAYINNLTIKEYKYILRNNETRSKTLEFVDPSLYHIHHIDGDHYNNDITNLQKLTISEHQKLHSCDNKYNFNQGTPVFSKVISLQYYGKDHTYDISCYENHNFVANGIVVHNSGKGFIAALICHVYNKSKILFIFDRIDLIFQTRDAFINKYNIPESDIGIIQDTNRQIDKRITLLSMMSYEKAIGLFPQIKIIVADEVHTTGRTETAQKIIYSCQNAPMHIGLSATADCIDNPAEQLRLYSIMGPIIYKKEIIEQINDKVLAKLNVEMHKVDGDVRVNGSWVDIYEKQPITKYMVEKFKQYYTREYAKEIDSSDAIELIIYDWLSNGENYSYEHINNKYYLRLFKGFGDESTHYVFNQQRNEKIKQLAERNDRVLILYTRKQHGELLQQLIHGSVLISGDSNMGERNSAEQFLKSNQKAVVLASNIWSTGKDIPEIQTLINAGGGVSQIQQIQKMGRATRLSSSTGKESAIIIDFYDEFSPLAKKQSKKRRNTYEKLGLHPIII